MPCTSPALWRAFFIHVYVGDDGQDDREEDDGAKPAALSRVSGGALIDSVARAWPGLWPIRHRAVPSGRADADWPPNYNVAPTHIMPVVRPVDSGRELAMMEWGLIPFFSKDGARSFTTFNARAEELRNKMAMLAAGRGFEPLSRRVSRPSVVNNPERVIWLTPVLRTRPIPINGPRVLSTSTQDYPARAA
ncbi:SOS response-associated peptidase family protein [Dongia deserti]|uniref:SOS response-associated peptidase family protein n=1 Tax=Dongia deserti TaxID=2268030 RepID=UPI000E655ED2|nr:SOS response-associated peptidase family protein [Dongia deserti]